MKPLLLLILLLPAIGYTQIKLPVNTEGKIAYEEIVSADSTLTAGVLYGKAISWFSDTFKSPKDAIRQQSPTTHHITANGLTNTNWTNIFNGDLKGKLSFKITLDFKDGRYKYLITDLVYVDNKYNSYPGLIEDAISKNKKYSEKAAFYIDQAVQGVISSLKSSMATKANW